MITEEVLLMSGVKPHRGLPKLGALCIPAWSLAVWLWPAASFASPVLVVTQNTTLTANHHGSVIMARDNVTLDCGGHSIIGEGHGRGIIVGGRSGVTVKNCNVTNFATGFWVSGSTGNTFEDNASFGHQLANDNQPAGWITGAGFWIQSSPTNVFRRNVSHNNPSDGLDVFNSPGNAFIENVFYANQAAEFFADPLSSGLNLSGNRSNQNGFGYLIDRSDGHVFSQNTAEGNTSDGFTFISTNGSSLIGNSSTGNTYGFVLTDNSHDNLIQENVACSNNEFDLVVGDAASTDNIFIDNTFCTIFGL